MSKKRGVFGFLICSILLLSLFTGFCMSNKKVSAITRTSDRIRKAVNTSEIPESYTPIYTVDDLVAINLNPKGNYILMNDIDLTEATAEGGSLDTGHGWTPLDSFSGVLDGNGYRIKGMHIYGDYTYETKSFRRCLGLFSAIGDVSYSNAVVKNLGVTDVSIDIFCNQNRYGYIGSLAGELGISGTIENVFCSGSIIRRNVEETSRSVYSFGGIAGLASGTISNCYSDVDITDEVDDVDHESSIFGICFRFSGNSYGGIVKNCYNRGMLTAATGKAYGISRYYTGMIRNCYYLYGSAPAGSTAEDASGIVMPLTESQMKSKAYYTGFDFKDTWILDSYSDYPYPQLRNCRHQRLESIKILSLPAKLTYKWGEDFDLTGATLELTYENDVIKQIEPTEDMVVGFASNRVGTEELYFSYGGINTDSFQVKIQAGGTARIVNLALEKKYTNYDITNDGEADTIWGEPEGNIDIGTWKNFKVYINNKCKLTLKPGQYFDDYVKFQLLTLSNGKSYLYIYLGGENEDGPSAIYEYKNNILKSIVDFDKTIKYTGYHRQGTVQKVSGDKITVKFFCHVICIKWFGISSSI